MRAQLALTALMFVLASCAGPSANTASAEYSAGYGDGCATGQARGTYPSQPPVRDAEAFTHNADYKSGWRAGYNACVVRHDPGP